MAMETTPAGRDRSDADAALRIVETILTRIRDDAGKDQLSPYFRLAAEALSALARILPARDGTPACGVTAALRLEYVLAHGWPQSGQQIHPQVGDPYWYWGDDPFTATSYSSALDAIDAGIAQAGVAVPLEGRPAMAPAVAAWEQRLATARGLASAKEIGAAKDAELADQRAARLVDRATFVALRDRCAVLQAQVAILRASPPGTCARRSHAAACAVVIRMLHESGMDDSAIADQLSLTAEHVGIIRTTSAALNWPELEWGGPAGERPQFELGEQLPALQRAGPGENGDYLDAAVENRWRGWLRRAGWPTKPAA